MFGTELALMRYFFEREMNRRRAEAEAAAAQRLHEESGVYARPKAPGEATVEPARPKRGSVG